MENRIAFGKNAGRVFYWPVHMFVFQPRAFVCSNVYESVIAAFPDRP